MSYKQKSNISVNFRRNQLRNYCRLERMPLVRYYSRKIQFFTKQNVFCFLTGTEILPYRLLQYFVGFASLRVLTYVCTN